MAVLTRSNSGRGAPNARARWALLLGLLAVATLPAAIAVATTSGRFTLLQAGLAVPLAGALGLVAVMLGRRALVISERTLGRIGGERLARFGCAFGALGLWLALTAALALGFYGLLSYFAS